MARNIVQEIRRRTRRHFAAERTIHMVPEGLPGEIPVSDPARRTTRRPVIRATSGPV